MAPVKSQITIADLNKIDIRVGQIMSVEDVSGSDKLVRLIVDFGDCRRNILAGIKQEWADPNAVEGTQALFVVNLEPKKMMGELSEGMLFDMTSSRQGARNARKNNPEKKHGQKTKRI